jgi:ribokinase
MKKIVVAGSLNMDLVVGATRLPQAGETVAGLSFATFEGGKGFNQGVAARRAGGEVAFIGKLGQDAFGDRLATALATEGINTAGVTRVPDQSISTGVASITVDAAGANTIVVVPGANFEFSPTDLDSVVGAFDEAGALLLQLEIPLAVCEKAAQLARQKGARVILTPAPVPAHPLPPGLLGSLDLLALNETEVFLMAALAAGNGDEIPQRVAPEQVAPEQVAPEQVAPEDEIAAARRLLGQPGRPGPAAVVVTLGERGAAWVTSGEVFIVPGFPVRPVDTTAAGDSFTGALAFALVQGLPPQEVLRFANAAGALAVTRAGAYPSIPTNAEINRLLDSRTE